LRGISNPQCGKRNTAAVAFDLGDSGYRNDRGCSTFAPDYDRGRIKINTSQNSFDTGSGGGPFGLRQIESRNTAHCDKSRNNRQHSSSRHHFKTPNVKLAKLVMSSRRYNEQ
jgi:hypothetical protein